MSNTEHIAELFQGLLDLCTDGEQEEFDLAYEKLKEKGLEFTLETEKSVEWDESQIEGYSEFPTVTQECKLLLGDVIVAKWERQFGIEFIDATHTGGGGRWCPFRLDDTGRGDIEYMLEEIGVDIIDPDVPEPR